MFRSLASACKFAAVEGTMGMRKLDGNRLISCVIGSVRYESTQAAGQCAPTLTKDRAKSLILKLTEEERNNLSSSLKEFESQLRKEEYKGENIQD